MMDGKYKYTPEQFSDMLCIPEELAEFYRLFEIYQEEKTEFNFHFLRKQLNDLLFAIKHRVVEHRLTPDEAAEIGGYVRGLVDD